MCYYEDIKEKTSTCEYIRRIDQFNVPADRRIAVDNGVPDSELDKKSLINAISGTVCRGIYSYNVATRNGEFTTVAIEVTKGPFIKELSV